MPSQNSADIPWDGNNPYAISTRAQQYSDIGDALRNPPFEFQPQNIQAGVTQKQSSDDQQDQLDASPWLRAYAQSKDLFKKAADLNYWDTSRQKLAPDQSPGIVPFNPNVQSVSNLLSNARASFTDQTGTVSFGPGSLNIQSSDPSQTSIGLNSFGQSLSFSRNFGNTNIELSGGLGSTPNPYPAGTDSRVYKWGSDRGPWAKLGFNYPAQQNNTAPQTENSTPLTPRLENYFNSVWKDHPEWAPPGYRPSLPPLPWASPMPSSEAPTPPSAGQQLWESGGYNR